MPLWVSWQVVQDGFYGVVEACYDGILVVEIVAVCFEVTLSWARSSFGCFKL